VDAFVATIAIFLSISFWPVVPSSMALLAGHIARMKLFIMACGAVFMTPFVYVRAIPSATVCRVPRRPLYLLTIVRHQGESAVHCIGLFEWDKLRMAPLTIPSFDHGSVESLGPVAFLADVGVGYLFRVLLLGGL
jgi:hypothetical protein